MRLIHAGAAAVLAVLGLPAIAAAHPSVYVDDRARVESPKDSGTFVPQTRYVVANHGFTYVLSEANGVPEHGVFDYKSIPAKLRAGKDWSWLLDHGTTGAQAHATCQADALETEAAIRSWQSTDPFYGYVPFQAGSAGLEDDPATWVPVVEARTGVDLATATDPEAACEALDGGTAVYVPADATQSSNQAFNSGLIEHTAEPLEAQIAALTGAVTDGDAAKAAVQGLLDAARAEIARLTAAAAPMTVALPSARMKPGALARGTRVAVAGPPGAVVTVRLAIARPGRLGLESSVLASAQAKLGAGGGAAVALRPGRAVRRALRSLKRPAALTVTARAADRIATSGATLAR